MGFVTFSKYMAASLSLFGALLLAVGPRPQDDARALVEKLRSDAIEDRDAAARKLKGLGMAALPELEKAGADRDAEVATRAKNLTAVIRVSMKLTPGLMAAIPGVEERLALGDAHAWTEALLEAVAAPEGKRRHPGLRTEDLDALAAPAVRGAKTTAETKAVAQAVGEFTLRSAARDLVDLLPGTMRKELMDDLAFIQGGSIESIVSALIKLRPKELIPELVEMVRNQHDGFGRNPATAVLVGLGNDESVPAFLPLLSDEAPMARAHAARVLAMLGSKEALPGLIKLLDDMTIVRGDAAAALGRLGAKESIPGIIKLLGDSEPQVLRNAMAAVSALDAKNGVKALIALLKHEDETVRHQALETLGRLEAREAIPAMTALLKDTGQWVRLSAAAWLVHLGSPEGITPMLKDDWAGSQFQLHALRRPELWSRLRKITIPEDHRTVGSTLVKQVAKEAGMAYDGPEFRVPIMTAGPVFTWERPKEPPRISLTDALAWSAGGDRDILLEEGRIRVVSRAEARRFWQAWWEEERKKIK